MKQLLLVLFFSVQLNVLMAQAKDFVGTWKVVTVEFNGQERTDQHPFSVLIIEPEILSLRDKQNAEFMFLEYIWENTDSGFVLINPQNAEQRITFDWMEDGTARFTGANYVFYLEED